LLNPLRHSACLGQQRQLGEVTGLVLTSHLERRGLSVRPGGQELEERASQLLLLRREMVIRKAREEVLNVSVSLLHVGALTLLPALTLLHLGALNLRNSLANSLARWLDLQNVHFDLSQALAVFTPQPEESQLTRPHDGFELATHTLLNPLRHSACLGQQRQLGEVTGLVLTSHLERRGLSVRPGGQELEERASQLLLLRREMVIRKAREEVLNVFVSLLLVGAFTLLHALTLLHSGALTLRNSLASSLSFASSLARSPSAMRATMLL